MQLLKNSENQLKEKFKINHIFIYGGMAKKKLNKSSDIDLLVDIDGGLVSYQKNDYISQAQRFLTSILNVKLDVLDFSYSLKYAEIKEMNNTIKNILKEKKMLKQITNLNGVNIGINRIVNGNSTKYMNQATNEIKTGTTMLYKFNNIPFNEIKKVANAKLLIPCLGYGTFEIGVFRNTSAYITSQTHGNNEPSFDDSTYIHYEKFTIGKSGGHPESKLLEINLTNLFNRWLSEEATNLSFTLRCLSTNTLTVFGPNHPELEGKTLFALTYAQTDTFSSSFDYLTDELSFGGQSFVNTLTGRLAHQFDVFQTESKKFPIKFAVNYIERLTGVTMKNSLIGNWRTNFDFGFKIEDNRITVASPEGSIAYFDKTLRENAAKHGIYIGTKPHCYINFTDNSYIVEDMIQNGYQRYKMYDASKKYL